MTTSATGSKLEVQPFRAWRFASHLDPAEVVCPLFDVISLSEREKYYERPVNAVNVSTPKPNVDVADLLASWKTEGLIEQDQKLSIYAYTQHFASKDPLYQNPNEICCRRGVVCLVKVCEYDEQIIYRHEDTLPESVLDRVKNLGDSLMMSSATHGLFNDPESSWLEDIVERAHLDAPLTEVRLENGDRDCVAAISDPVTISRIQDYLSSKKIMIADGHHRYEASVVFSRINGALGKYHMMYLTNANSNGMSILPTHRVIRQLGKSLVAFKNFIRVQLKDFADFEEYKRPRSFSSSSLYKHLLERIANRPHTFAVCTKSQDFVFTLKVDPRYHVKWALDDSVKTLDVTVLHYFLIEQACGIPFDKQKQTKLVKYEKNGEQCIDDILSGESDLAIVLNPVRISQVEHVCFSNSIMPPKSSYFHPKTLAGLLFASLTDARPDDGR